MAIKRIDVKATFKVISRHDEALDVQETPGASTEPGADPALSGYDQYLEELTLNESVLRFKEGQKPDRFLLRGLTADELADINGRHIFADPVNKKVIYTNQNKWFLEMFKAGYMGIEDAEGKTTRPPLDEIPYPIQVELGAVVSMIASLGKNLKKP